MATPEWVKQRVSDFGVVFGSPEGKRILANLEELFWNRTSVAPGDPFLTHVREGERNVIRHIRWHLNLHKNPRELARVLDKPTPNQEEDPFA